jgi:spore germination protein
VEQSLRYALQFVPREKLSLGLGFWAYGWCKDEVTYFGYREVEGAQAHSGARLQWLDAQKAPWFEFDENGCHKTVYFENRRSLHEKMKLIGRYHLHGFSAWRLGQEDPEFWKEMHERKRKKQPSQSGR